jgi:predicted double-glycine peptidase
VTGCLQACEARWLSAILFLCALLSLNGCATAQDTAAQGRITRIEVPFFPQEDFQCGPAALATVLNYWYGKAGMAKGLTPEEIVAEIYSPSARGVLGIDLELYARKEGFQTQQVAGTVDALKSSVDKGIPAVVLVDYGFSVYQRNHFMVVKGYTDSALLVNSGRRENELIANGDLLKVWKKTGYWMLLVKP